MNGSDDFSLTDNSGTPDPKNCSLVSIIPIVGMSSCRGRAEAFARRLSSKLRTLGTQADDADVSHEDEPIINGGNTNTWITVDGGENTVTNLQPLRHESDSFFDFDCEIESPGSPVDECEYLRLIESSSNTPHNSTAESGYACASAASSHSSSDGPYFDVNSENEAHMCHLQHQQQNQMQTCETHQLDKDDVDCISSFVVVKENGQCNGYKYPKDSIQALPSEGPDIDMCHQEDNLEQHDIIQSVQEQILEELHRQSQEYKEEKTDDGEKHKEESETETSAETATETETATITESSEVAEAQEQEKLKQIINILNCPEENGEDVLKVEIEEVPKIEANEQISESNKNDKDLTENKDFSKGEIPKIENDTSKSTHLNMDTMDDEDECRPQKLRRSSSLKTGKTPPGTPGRKKFVRFADVLGLDLADVKTFLDEVPTIPRSAYEDLEILETEPPIQLGPKSDKFLMPLFQQPGGLPNFLDIVRDKLVSLENAAVTDAINQTITGCVRVRNLDFHKSVHIRYSLDGWRSFADLQANYVNNSCDGFSDKFSFILFGNSLHIGQRLEFAVRFQCKGQQYWDNNYGANYCFQCLPNSAPAIHPVSAILPSHHCMMLSPTIGDSWCSSFY